MLFCAVQTSIRMWNPGLIDALRHLEPDLICFPEYYLFDRDRLTKDSKLFERMLNLSRVLDCVIVGGTTPIIKGDRRYNSAWVFGYGAILGNYLKRNPFGGEVDEGIEEGDHSAVFIVQKYILGVVICADILDDKIVDRLAIYSPDVIAVPTNSPKRPEDSKEEKIKRDTEIFLAAAKRTGALIVKSCATGYAGERELQGRSLIAHPEGRIIRSPFDAENRELIVYMDESGHGGVVVLG